MLPNHEKHDYRYRYRLNTALNIEVVRFAKRILMSMDATDSLLRMLHGASCQISVILAVQMIEELDAVIWLISPPTYV